MPSTRKSITFGGVELDLIADRAIHWPHRQTLIVADVHLGKDATFRRFGLPVPAGNSTKDLSRLERLLKETESKRLVVLGDLVHAKSSHQAELSEAFGVWRRDHPKLDILLIRGNHDRSAGPVPADWRIEEVAEPFDDGPLTYVHHARPTEQPHLCGHIHPVVAVRDFDRSLASIPCFVLSHSSLTLPAFGSFTGGFKVQRDPAHRLFAATGTTVVKIH